MVYPLKKKGEAVMPLLLNAMCVFCSASSFVTSGRGQPTMTTEALAFRTAEHMIAFAKRGEI